MPTLSKPASSPANQAPSTASMQRTALTVCLVSSFISPFIGACLNIALPTMAKELHLDAVTVLWVLTIFMLASSIFMLPMERLADIYGRKKMGCVQISGQTLPEQSPSTGQVLTEHALIFGSNLQEGVSPPKMNAPEKMFAIGWTFFLATPGDMETSSTPLSDDAVEPVPPPRPR